MHEETTYGSKMSMQKRKLTFAEKTGKKRRSLEYITIFINGKQKRVKRPQVIDGMEVDEFIRRNADQVLLHQMEMWEYMNTQETEEIDGEAARVIGGHNTNILSNDK